MTDSEARDHLEQAVILSSKALHHACRGETAAALDLLAKADLAARRAEVSERPDPTTAETLRTISAAAFAGFALNDDDWLMYTDCDIDQWGVDYTFCIGRAIDIGADGSEVFAFERPPTRIERGLFRTRAGWPVVAVQVEMQLNGWWRRTPLYRRFDGQYALGELYEMHALSAGEPSDAKFRPEPWIDIYQQIGTPGDA